MITSEEPSLVERFAAAMDLLVPAFKSGDNKLGLAVSGGPDSLALLLLGNSSFPGRIAAATVDHGLRSESRSEAEFVGNLCHERGIPHQILSPSVPIRGSIQTVARKVRYGLLNDWAERENLDWLATAHHADDQLETLVMRALRGSGLDGMSAIRARRGHIIRPLLHMSKQLLEDYVAQQGVVAIDDPSNRDQSFDRVRVRKALSRLEGFDIGLASRSAAALDDARDSINWMVEKLAETHIEKTSDGCTLDQFDFPHEIMRRLLLKCLHIGDPALSPRGEQIERTLSALDNGETITLGNTLCQGGENWTFSTAPRRQNS